jgi:hypothetical protein
MADGMLGSTSGFHVFRFVLRLLPEEEKTQRESFDRVGFLVHPIT